MPRDTRGIPRGALDAAERGVVDSERSELDLVERTVQVYPWRSHADIHRLLYPATPRIGLESTRRRLRDLSDSGKVRAVFRDGEALWGHVETQRPPPLEAPEWTGPEDASARPSDEDVLAWLRENSAPEGRLAADIALGVRGRRSITDCEAVRQALRRLEAAGQVELVGSTPVAGGVAHVWRATEPVPAAAAAPQPVEALEVPADEGVDRPAAPALDLRRVLAAILNLSWPATDDEVLQECRRICDHADALSGGLDDVTKEAADLREELARTVRERDEARAAADASARSATEAEALAADARRQLAAKGDAPPALRLGPETRLTDLEGFHEAIAAHIAKATQRHDAIGRAVVALRELAALEVS